MFSQIQEKFPAFMPNASALICRLLLHVDRWYEGKPKLDDLAIVRGYTSNGCTIEIIITLNGVMMVLVKHPRFNDNLYFDPWINPSINPSIAKSIIKYINQ